MSNELSGNNFFSRIQGYNSNGLNTSNNNDSENEIINEYSEDLDGVVFDYTKENDYGQVDFCVGEDDKLIFDGFKSFEDDDFGNV